MTTKPEPSGFRLVAFVDDSGHYNLLDYITRGVHSVEVLLARLCRSFLPVQLNLLPCRFSQAD